MTQEAERVDIRTVPGLSLLVEEVMRSRRPRLIQRDGETVALLVPAGRVETDQSRFLPDETNVRSSVRYRSFDEFLQDRETSPQVFSWREIEETVDQDRVQAWRSKNP